MSVVKHNTYFKENDGKVYYYDAEGIKKEVPSTAFSNLQEQIDNLGSPLTYSGAQSVDELNELIDIKTGTVYTVTGNSGTLTAGGIDVQPSTEVAWAGEWFNIGKDLDNSWKQWSEGKGSEGDSNSVYIGNRNSAYQGGYSIGTMNESLGYITEVIIPPENDTIEFKDQDDNTATLKLGFYMVPAPTGAGIAATAINMCFLPEIYGPRFKNYDFNDFNNNSAVVNIDNETGNSIYQDYLTNGYWTSSYYGTPLTYNTIIPCKTEEITRINAEQSELASECKIEQMGIPSMSIGQSNTALQAGYSIGAGNSADSTTMSLGFSNSSYGNSVALGDGNTAQYMSVAIGKRNNAQYGTHILGDDNIIEGAQNVVIGKQNKTLNTNDSYILGKNNTMSGNYINNNTVIGNSNTASGTHNSFIIGENNTTVDQEGAGNSYVLGQNNAAGDCSITLGTANSSQPGSMYKATLGWENKVGNSNNVVIGGNNSANENVGNTTIIAGYYNESSGGHAYGNNNKVNAESYAYGYNNSAIEGGVAIGKNLYVSYGGVSLGETQSSINGAVTIGAINSATNGSKVVIGQGNSASNGGGVIGDYNIGGKGGYIVGYGNISRKYKIINPDNPSTSSIEYEEAPLGSLWSQNTFGFNNYTQFKKENGSYTHGMPFQIGSYNIVQDEITWNSDYDIDTARTYHNGGGYIGTFNIGTNNSAFDEGINIGYKNTILIGDESAASINIGKDNVNRMGIIIGQRNVTYDTMTLPSSTNTKSNAYSWILGQGNSANGASVAIGNGTKAQQGSYTFGGWGIQSYSGAMSIGLNSVYSDCGAIAIGQGATAYSGSLAIGCNGLYTVSASFGFGNSVTAQKGSIGIGRNSVYATDDGYAIGEYVSAGSDAVGIGRYVYTTGHGYAFGYEVTGEYEGIAVGLNGITANGRGAAFGFESVYSNGGSITLGHNGIYANATAVALGSNGLNSDFRSIAIGQFGVTATSAGLTIGNENVYSTDRAIAIGKYGVGACGWGSFAIGIKGISADNTSWAIGYGGNAWDGHTINYLSAHISATNESYSLGQSGVSSCNNSFTIGRKNVLASNESFVLGQRFIFAHDNSFNIGISGADNSKPYNEIEYDWNYGTWSNSFAIGRGRNVAHSNSFILGIHNYSNINLPYSADYNSIMMAVGDGLSSRTLQDSVSIASYGSYDGLSGKSTVEYQSLLLDHQVLGEVEVKNKSIMIGGPSFCQFHFNDVYSALSANVKEGSAKADHASIVLGYNNIADGGVFAIGSNNTACDLYSEYSGYTQYTQATIFGDYNRAINYRGTIYSNDVNPDLYNNDYDKNTQYTQESGFTRSLIVGTNNSLSGWNSFIFGINNSAGSAGYALGTYDTSDDGFTLVFGHSNYAVRNYDMAFGWKSFASGGENIAIGTPQQIDSYNVKCTSAIGYKNIAIRSNVTGIANVAINTIIDGTSIEPSLNYRYSNTYLNSHLTFDETYDESQNYNTISNTILTGTNLRSFNYNILENCESAVLSGAFNNNYIRHNKNINIITDYVIDGIQHNDILHCYKFELTNSSNECSNNLFYNISNKTSTSLSSSLISYGGINNNVIFNTELNVTTNSYVGFNNNFAHNSIFQGKAKGISHTYSYASTSYYSQDSEYGTNNNVLYFSKYIFNPDSVSNNYPDIISASTKKGAGRNFLFGTYAVNVYGVYSFSDVLDSVPDIDDAIIIDSVRCFNVNDNHISASTNVAVLGEKNGISGINVGHIFGNFNGVSAIQTDKSDYVTIIGTENTYNNYGIDEHYTLNNRIFGSNNSYSLRYNGHNDTDPITNNTIIGDCNAFLMLTKSNLSGYINLFEFYKKTTNTIGTYYHADQSYGTKTYGDPTTGNNRNILLGSHNALSQYINDTILIGSRNAIINGTSVDIKSNNYALGSYNLLSGGSNQIVLGTNNVSTGYNSTAIGEGLISKQSQFVVGRFNEELDGTNGLSADGIDSTSGALFIVGNGKHIDNDYAASAVVRSNAMIVSADGTVSARRFIESEPALTITGGDFVTVTEDTTNNKLVIDLESSLGQMLTELSGVLTAKPSTGRHILGVDGGTLTWLEVNQ